MATFDTQTREAIIRNGYLLSTLTRERIWEEIKKSYSQVKYFPDYLTLLFELDIAQYIFPKMKLNLDIIECKNLVVYLANLLKDNDIQTLEKKMIFDLKIESGVSSKVCHLIRLFDLSPTNAFSFYKDRVRCHVDNTTIEDWSRINGLDKNLFSAFINYKPTVSSEDLMNKGFKGKDLGEEIKRLEIEKFSSLL